MPCPRVLSLLLLLSMPVCLFAAECPTDAEIVGQPGMVESEFIYEPVRWPQSHSPTIEEAAGGNLVASWFGGTGEGHPDVCIWACCNDGRAWSKPVKVADGIRKDVLRRPCCNPVLFQADSGPLMLFYKLQSLECKTDWQGWKLYSHDGGQTYGDSIALPEGFLGPIKNKPIQLDDGSILCPSSTEGNGFRVHFERTDSQGKHWTKTPAVADPQNYGGIQPTLFHCKDGRLLALNRTKKGSKIAQTFSTDGGQTWSPLKQIPLPNNWSGIDGVTLSDGRHLLVYNHATLRPDGRNGPRSPLNVVVSEDDGKSWKAALVLENQKGEFSYPAVIKTQDGLVHISYTWNRRTIKHVVLDPSELVLREMPDGRWPSPALTPKK